ncbi:MAG: GAF domain-containing protein, partial [Anaerolineales bacterium]|nr:GAF domain-containing protein [Anaerolineales bacterium]
KYNRLFIALIAVTLWLLAFPLQPTSKWVWNDILLELIPFIAALAGYLFIVRLQIPILQFGWEIFTLAMIFDLLDEFTKEPDLWNTTMPGALQTIGLIVIAVGFFLAYRQQQMTLALTDQIKKSLNDKVTTFRFLTQLAQALNSDLSWSEQINLLLEHAITHLRVDAGCIARFNSTTEMLEPLAFQGARDASVFKRPADAGQGAAGWIITHGTSLAISQVAEDARWVRTPALDKEGWVSYLGAPLQIAGNVIGVIEVLTRAPRPFTSDEIEFINLMAGQTSIVLNRAHTNDPSRG